MTMIFQNSIAKSIKNNVRSVFLIFFIFVPLFTIQDLQADIFYSREKTVWDDRTNNSWGYIANWTRNSTHRGNISRIPGTIAWENDTVVIAAGHTIEVRGNTPNCVLMYIGTGTIGTSIISQPYNGNNKGTLIIENRGAMVGGTDLTVRDKMIIINGSTVKNEGGNLWISNSGIEYIGTGNLFEMYQDDNNRAPQVHAGYFCRHPDYDNAEIHYLNRPGKKAASGYSRYTGNPPNTYTNRATYDNPNGITDCQCGDFRLENVNGWTPPTTAGSINANNPKFYDLLIYRDIDASFATNGTITIGNSLNLCFRDTVWSGNRPDNIPVSSQPLPNAVLNIGNNTLLFNVLGNNAIRIPSTHTILNYNGVRAIKLDNGGRIISKRTNGFTYGSGTIAPVYFFPTKLNTEEYVGGVVNFSNGDQFGANSIVEFSPRAKTLVFNEPVINSRNFYIDFKIENINFTGTAIPGNDKFASIDVYNNYVTGAEDSLRLLYEIFDVAEPIQRIGECVHEDVFLEQTTTGNLFKQSFKIVDLGARPIDKHLAILFANRFYSVQSGNWKEDLANYSNAVWTPLKTHQQLGTSNAYKRFFLEPNKDSRVVIAKNHNITINSVAECGYLYIGSDNDVVSIPGETSNDKKGILNVTNGATLTIGEFVDNADTSKLNIMNNAILNVNNATQVAVKGNSLFDGIGATINISDINTGFINEGIFKYKHDNTPSPTSHSINISNGEVDFYKGLMREQGVVNDGATLNFTQSAGIVSIYECDPLNNRSEFDAPNGVFNVTGGEIVFEPVRTGNTGNNILAIDVPNNTTFYKLISRVDNVDASKANMNLIVSNALQLATTVSGNNIFNIASNTLTFDGGDAVNFGEEFIYVSNSTSASLDDFSVSRSILKTPDGHVIYSYTNGSTPIAFNQDKKFLFPISMEDRFFGSSINLKGNSTEFLSNSNTTIEILPFLNSPHYQIPIESGVNAYWKTDLQGVVTLGAPDLELFLEPNEITTGKIHRIDNPTNAIAYRLYSSTNTLNVVNTTLQASATEISNQPSPLWEWVPAGTNSSENYWSILSLKLTFYSLTDGLWSDPNSWTYLNTHSGIPMAYPPTAEDEVIISAGHTISVESDAVCAYLFVGSDNTISVPHNSVLSGQLLFPATGSGNLVVGELKRDVEATKVKIQKESLLDISGENSKMKVYGHGVRDKGFSIIGNSTLNVRNLGLLELEQIEVGVGAATCNVEGATSSQFSEINLRGNLVFQGVSSIVNITDSARVLVQPYEANGGRVYLTGGNLNVSEKGLLEVDNNLNISANGTLNVIDTGKVQVNTYISLNGNAGANLVVKNRANVIALDSIVYSQGNNAKITLEHTDNDDAHTTLINTYALRRGSDAADDNISITYEQTGGELRIQNVSGNPISVPANRSNLDLPNATFIMSNTVHSPASPSIPFSQINGNIRFVGGANASQYSMYLPSEAEAVKLIVSESSVLAKSNFRISEVIVLLDNGKLDLNDKTLTLLGGDHNKVYGASWADNLEAFSKNNSIYLYEQGGGKVVYSYPAGIPQTINTEFMFPISRVASDSTYMGSSLILPDGYTTFNSNATIGLMPYPTAPVYAVSPSKFFDGYWKTSFNNVVVDNTSSSALVFIEFHYNQYSGTIESMPLMRIEDITTSPVLFPVSYQTSTTTEPETGYFKNVTHLNPPTATSGWDWVGDNYWTFAALSYTSIRSGRWSDPMTWNVGSVPSSTDEVELRHIVYTGLYDDNTTDILGSRQWAGAEEDISGADLSVSGVAKLCKKLTILGDGTNDGGLLIGNNAPAPTNGARRVLSFGEVYNNSLGDENLELNLSINSFKVTSPDLDALILKMKGIYIMEDGGTGSANLFKPQMQVLKIENKGAIFNSSILEIGSY
jgi:hypothetical protein